MDPYLWSSVVELSEMGIEVDTEKLYKVNTVEMTPSKFHSANRPNKVTVAENEDSKLRDMSLAESLSMSRDNTPARTSLSLGMSSMSIRMPFATPSSMPSPIPATTTNNIQGPKTADSAISHAGPIPINFGTAFSTDQRVPLPAGGTVMMRGEVTTEKSAMSHDPRATLFGFPTPGLTPIVNQLQKQHLQDRSDFSSEGYSMAHDVAQEGGEDAEQHAYIGNLAFSSSGTGFHAPAVQSLPPLPAELSSAVKEGAQQAHHSARRVSFGPTAQMSLSGISYTDSPGYASSPVKSSGTSNSVDTVTAAEAASGDGNLSDEHPSKLQRTNSTPQDTPVAAAMSPPTADSTRRITRSVTKKAAAPMVSPPPAPMDSPPGGTTVKKKPSRGSSSSPGGDGAPPVITPMANKGAMSRDELGSHVYNGPESLCLDDLCGDSTVGGKTKPSAASLVASAAAWRQVKQLVAVFVRAFQLIGVYHCKEAVDVLHQLPRQQFKAAYVHQLLGKAYYEMNDYKAAILAFREMLRLEPFRLHGLELLSAALWQLKKDKELSALSQQVIEIDKYAPETWCVVGNCFSLQKEPEVALKYFHRAVQLDPQFYYAHTLSGHEQIHNEDLEKAITAFRHAIALSERHYNAWYGLGIVYNRQEKYELAEYHFRRAFQINSGSSVLHCYLAMSLHSQNNNAKTSEALRILQEACEIYPNNSQLHFQRAHIYVSIESFEDALSSLQIVMENAPKEAPVFALLGQVYYRLGKKHLAIKHLMTAMDLDPKEATSLKSIMEQINSDENLDPLEGIEEEKDM